MLDKIKPKSEFTRNVLTLMTGTTIAQAVPVAISPILTRLYTPEDFGVWAVYASMVAILGVIATGKYELAVILPKTKKESLNVLFLSLLLTVVVSLSFSLFLFVLTFHSQIIQLLNNKEISGWLYFIPLSVLLVGFYNSFNYWFNRNKRYKLLASTKVVQTLVNGGFSLGFGFAGMTKIGLIFSSILSQFAGVMAFLKNFKFVYFRLFDFKLVKNLAKRYIKFPSITLFHHLFNNASTNIPVLLIANYFNNMEAGFFSFTNRIIGYPLSIITSSMGEVFFREINRLKVYEPSKLTSFFKNILLKMFIILFPIFIMLFFILPPVVEFVFGENWKNLGIYIQILLPMFFFRGIGSVLAHIIVVFGKQGQGFALEIISFILRVVSIVVGSVFHSIVLALILFSLTSSLITIYRIGWYYQIIKRYRNDL